MRLHRDHARALSPHVHARRLTVPRSHTFRLEGSAAPRATAAMRPCPHQPPILTGRQRRISAGTAASMSLFPLALDRDAPFRGAVLKLCRSVAGEAEGMPRVV